jgi:predicted PurR-regulated permease PerM
MRFDRKYLLALIPLAIGLALIYYFRSIVSYVIIAWVISMIGAPIVTFLRKYIGKESAALVTISLFGIILVLLLYLFIPPVVNQARYLSKVDYNKVVKTIEQPIKDWENWLVDRGMIKKVSGDTIQKIVNKPSDIFENKIVLDSLLNPTDSTYLTNVSINLKIDASDLVKSKELENEKLIHEEDFFNKFKQNLIYYINPSRIQQFFSSTFSAFGSIAVGIVSVFFIGYFFLKEQGLFYEMVKTIVPVKYESQMAHAIDDSSRLLIRYFVGILIQMTFIMLFVSIFLAVLGIENALLIGFIAAVTNVIPYIGPTIGAAFGVMIAIASNIDVSFYDNLIPEVVKVLAVFGIMQFIDNFILQPTIFSKSVKAHPLEIFLIVMIGAKLGGVMGMVLAIPFYTVFRVLAKVFLSEFKVVQKITRDI